METTVEPQEGNKVKLTVAISEAEFETAMDAAFRKIAQEVRLPGFRPGKVPRRILEQRVGLEAARQQALKDSLPEFYVKALVENDVDAISSAETSARLNPLPPTIHFRVADFRSDEVAAANVVLANLTGGMLRTSGAAIAALVRPGGTLILSGFDDTEVAAVSHAFSSFDEMDRLEEGSWLALRLRQP